MKPTAFSTSSSDTYRAVERSISLRVMTCEVPKKLRGNSARPVGVVIGAVGAAGPGTELPPPPTPLPPPPPMTCTVLGI
jgi:hypothetical protein